MQRSSSEVLSRARSVAKIKGGLSTGFGFTLAWHARVGKGGAGRVGGSRQAAGAVQHASCKSDG